MNDNSQTARLGGIIVVLGGIAMFLGDALHPTGGASDYHTAVAWQMTQPTGPIASWLVLAGVIAVGWGIWLLLDSAWRQRPALVQAGARLVVMAAVFMAVQTAVELAMRTAAAQYAAGAPVPMVRLRELMYAGGLPALVLGWILLIWGLPAAAPLAIRVIGTIGCISLGLAGPLVDGTHHLFLWPLYLGGVLALIWLVWMGVVTARGRVAALPA